MQPLIRFENVSFRYPEADKFAIENVNLDVEQGQFLLVVGRSGSGKSTLLRCINGLVPQFTGGQLCGKVSVFGASPKAMETSCRVSMVFQDPESQIVMTDVENEIAFGLENLCLCRDEISKRIDEAVRGVGIGDLMHRNPAGLSGGEKQRVVLASALAMKPEIVILDEPTSQLDPESAGDVLHILKNLKNAGTTVIISEHRISRVIGFADMVFDIECNRIIPKDEAVRKYEFFGSPCRKPQSKNIAVDVKNLSFSYDKEVLKNAEMVVYDGEFVAIAGRNGCGKTTLIKHLNGLLRPDSGKVLIFGKDIKNLPTDMLARHVGYVSQNPDEYLFSDTVAGELEFTLKSLGAEGDITGTLEYLGIAHLGDSCPRDLSCGEKQRVALASILVAKPRVLVLDEPTRGMDREGKKGLLRLIRRMQADGKTIIVVTHDTHLAGCADRILYLDRGVLK